MKIREAVEAARYQGNTPLSSRLTSEQMKELLELAAINWRILAETMRERWNQPRLQAETLKRNLRRISHDAQESSGRGR